MGTKKIIKKYALVTFFRYDGRIPNLLHEGRYRAMCLLGFRKPERLSAYRL